MDQINRKCVIAELELISCLPAQYSYLCMPPISVWVGFMNWHTQICKLLSPTHCISAVQCCCIRPSIKGIKAPNLSWSPSSPLPSSVMFFHCGLGQYSYQISANTAIHTDVVSANTAIHRAQRVFQVAEGHQPSAGARSRCP